MGLYLPTSDMDIVILGHWDVIPQLVSIVKQFLLERDLAKVFTGGLSSYTVTILIISFLQLHPRRDPCSDNLGVLLIEFLHLYGHDFNYSSLAVSIRDGRRKSLNMNITKLIVHLEI